VVKEIAAVDLHPEKIPNIAMGYVFEDLVRRFNEQANEEAGDHFTPREVIKLMVKLLFTHDDLVYKPAKVIKIYDPTCGTGGMLSESEKLIADPDTGLNPGANVQLFGQEYNPESFAICGSDLMIKGEEVKNIVFGDTLGTGKAKEGFVDGDGHPEALSLHAGQSALRRRMEAGEGQRHPRAQRVWLQGPLRPRPAAHQRRCAAVPAAHDLQDAAGARSGGEGSRIAIVFNGSPLFTGDAGSGESNIRRWIIENDMLEAVIGLPDQLFYNTGIYTYVWIVTNRKPPRARRQGAAHQRHRVRLEDEKKPRRQAQAHRRRQRWRAQTTLPSSPACMATFKHDVRMTLGEIQTNIDPKRDQAKSLFVSKIFDNRDFGYLKITVERPLRLNFASTDERIARVQATGAFTDLAISQKRKDKAKIAEEEILRAKPRRPPLLQVLNGMKPAFAHGNLSRIAAFSRTKQLSAAFIAPASTSTPSSKTALLAPVRLGEKDPSAEICRDKKGKSEPDADLRDTENVPLPAGIALPLPLDYEGKKNKGKVDVAPLLALVEGPLRGLSRRRSAALPARCLDRHEQDQGRLRNPLQPPLLRIRAAPPAGSHRGRYRSAGEGHHGHAEGGHGMRSLTNQKGWLEGQSVVKDSLTTALGVKV
jgi:type I restriction enzyme M protein